MGERVSISRHRSGVVMSSSGCRSRRSCRHGWRSTGPVGALGTRAASGPVAPWRGAPDTCATPRERCREREALAATTARAPPDARRHRRPPLRVPCGHPGQHGGRRPTGSVRAKRSSAQQRRSDLHHLFLNRSLEIAFAVLVDEETAERPDTGTDQRTCAGLRAECTDGGAGRKTDRGAASDTRPGGASTARKRGGRK
jgi:hypothetical protein